PRPAPWSAPSSSWDAGSTWASAPRAWGRSNSAARCGSWAAPRSRANSLVGRPSPATSCSPRCAVDTTAYPAPSPSGCTRTPPWSGYPGRAESAAPRDPAPSASPAAGGGGCSPGRSAAGDRGQPFLTQPVAPSVVQRRQLVDTDGPAQQQVGQGRVTGQRRAVEIGAQHLATVGALSHTVVTHPDRDLGQWADSRAQVGPAAVI